MILLSMFLRLNKEEQKNLINLAVKKAGNYRKLANKINIPRSSLDRYSDSDTIPEEQFNKIIDFLEIKNKEDIILERLENNWKQKKGGKKCKEIKILRGDYDLNLKKAQKRGALKMKEWHRKMKSEHPEEYYLLQYSKFKKIGGYKYTTQRGEKVRNKFEKDVADLLNKLKINYQYEPLINIDKKYFFPDFLIDNKIIIEATAWKGKIKAYKLKEKIKELEKKYKVYVVIPKNLYSYYQILNNHLIVGLDNLGSHSSAGRALDC